MDDINVILEEFEKVRAACQEMKGKKIRVGILGAQSSEVLTVAHAHEYGVPDKLPERSFIRASFDQDKEKLQNIVAESLVKMLNGKITPDGAAQSIGAQATQLVWNFIDDNRVKPQSDFSRKKQKTTLYETGTHIRDRIAYEVVIK